MGIHVPWDRARKTKSRKQEERIGKMQGGSMQNNSGRFWRWKRDGKLHGFLIEARTTDKNSYTIQYKEFKDLEKEAHQEPPGHLPAMQIDIRDLSLITVKLIDWQDIQVRLVELETRVEMLERELDAAE